jgi:hypothetical protein
MFYKSTIFQIEELFDKMAGNVQGFAQAADLL